RDQGRGCLDFTDGPKETGAGDRGDSDRGEPREPPRVTTGRVVRRPAPKGEQQADQPTHPQPHGNHVDRLDGDVQNRVLPCRRVTGEDVCQERARRRESTERQGTPRSTTPAP